MTQNDGNDQMQHTRLGTPRDTHYFFDLRPVQCPPTKEDAPQFNSHVYYVTALHRVYLSPNMTIAFYPLTQTVRREIFYCARETL
jgi:hypothetical protein